MPNATDFKLFDKRVAHRYLKKGRLDEKEYQRHLDALPDLADVAEEVEAEFQPTIVPARQHGTPANEPDGLED